MTAGETGTDCDKAWGWGVLEGLGIRIAYLVLKNVASVGSMGMPHGACLG